MKTLLRAASSLLFGAVVVSGLTAPPASSQQFWSPREIVLDTYTRPIPFRLGDETCLAYELHITNMDQVPISLKTIDVYGSEMEAPVTQYSGERLDQSLSRIRVLGMVEQTNVLSPGQRAILHVMLGFSDGSAVPKALTHRVAYTFLPEDRPEVGVETQGGELAVEWGEVPLLLGAPFNGGIWLAARGVDDGFAGHRQGAIRPQAGVPFQKARYAFDFTRFSENGDSFRENHTDYSQNESWLSYGSEAIAVAEGRIHSVQDGVPDSRPLDPGRLSQLTGQTLGGNYIILDLGNDLFAFYGHLKPGSLTVREGQAVEKGQVLGLVGNSGNSTLPHLHFQVNREIPLRGEAVPYVFEGFDVLGESSRTGPYPTMMIELTIRSVRLGVLDELDLEPSGLGGQGFESPAVLIRENIRRQLSQGLKPAWALDEALEPEPRSAEMPRSGWTIRFRSTKPRAPSGSNSGARDWILETAGDIQDEGGSLAPGAFAGGPSRRVLPGPMDSSLWGKNDSGGVTAGTGE